MGRSLINPNQVRAFGIQVCDDLTDPNRDLGITLPEVFVPMLMKGSICGFESRCPTDEELYSCQRFQISDEITWDPTAKIFMVAAEWGEGSQDEISRHICRVSTNLHDGFIFNDSHFFHDFDRCLIEQSSVYDRLIQSAISNKRHHGTDPNLLSRKWGISLKKARDTLSKTTQLNIRSALLPLTRRYQTDLLSQRLKRLSARFYTDTAFSKIGNSIRGNECVQIFTDRESSIFAYPLRSKSNAGTALQDFCSQVGVPHELHCDNAPEMSGNGTIYEGLQSK